MAFETLLAHRSRPHRSRHDSRHRNSYNDQGAYGATKPSRRTSNQHHRHDGSEYEDEREPFQRSHKGLNRASKISLEDAINDLFNALAETSDFYARFKMDFDRDVESIISYAGSHVLTELWGQKASALDNRRNAGGGAGPDEHDSSPTMTFKTAYHQLQSAFDAALHASPSRKPMKTSHEEQANRETYTRLMSKLEAGASDILKLARNAIKRTGDADALVTELELTSRYLEKSRGLWSTEDHGESQGSRREQRHDQGGFEEDGEPESGMQGEPVAESGEDGW